MRKGGRWNLDRAQQWHESSGWIVGCNFLPSTAINQIEMFQPGTYDPKTIERELGWARTTRSQHFGSMTFSASMGHFSIPMS